jgi:hypothetical protein
VPQGVIFYFAALVVATMLSVCSHTLVAVLTLFFYLPGLSLALAPSLLTYSLASLGVIVLVWRGKATAPLLALAALPVIALAVMPHWVASGAFDRFARQATRDDFSRDGQTNARVFALSGVAAATHCADECRSLLEAGAREVWIGGLQPSARYKLGRCSTRDNSKLGQGCIVTVDVAQASPDVLIKWWSEPTDSALYTERRNWWRLWTVLSVKRYEISERVGAGMRLVERRTRVEGRVAGWPFVTVPTIGSRIQDIHTAVNRNWFVVNDTSALGIARRRYNLAPNLP